MLGPAHRPIRARHILDGLSDVNGAVDHFDATLDTELRHRQHRVHAERCFRPIDLEPRNRGFAVHRHACGSFLGRWSAENIETQVVSHDPGEQG